MVGIEKWKQNLINIYEYNKVGKCPFCGSENTDFGFVKLNKIGYGDLWCNDCKHAFHISRVVWDDKKYRRQKQAPQGLKYV